MTKRRSDDRTYYDSVKDGLVAFDIHDLSDQQGVLDAAQRYARAVWYMPIGDPDQDNLPVNVDEYIDGARGDIVVWIPQSMSHLVVGHNYKSPSDYKIRDGQRIVIKVSKSGFEVHPLKYERNRAITFPPFSGDRALGSKRRSRGRSKDGILPDLHTTLPSSGQCDR